MHKEIKKSEEERVWEKNIIVCRPVTSFIFFFKSGKLSQSLLRLFYSVLTRVRCQCMITGPCQTAVSGKRGKLDSAASQITPPTPVLLCTIISTARVKRCVLYILFVHHPPPCWAFFLRCFVSSYCCSFLSPAAIFTLRLLPPTLIQHVMLVVVSRRNRSCVKPPVTLRSRSAMNVCAFCTLSSLPAQRRPHRIYILATRAVLTPGTVLS